MARKYKIYQSKSTLLAHLFFKILGSLGTGKPEFRHLIKSDNPPKKLSQKGNKKLEIIFYRIMEQTPSGFFDTEMAEKIAEYQLLRLKALKYAFENDERELRLCKNELSVLEHDIGMLQKQQGLSKSSSYIDNCADMQRVTTITFDMYTITLEQYIAYKNQKDEIEKVQSKWLEKTQ